jgi:hypothetical protein
MKINITKKQYRQLLFMNGLAGHILGIIGDSLPEKYKEKSNKLDELDDYLLSFAKDYECEEWVDEYDGKNRLDDEAYEKYIVPIMNDYDDDHFWNTLANKLAWRDFTHDHSKEEIKEMAKENNGYFGVPLYEYEQRYWKEFEKHDIARLEIDE